MNDLRVPKMILFDYGDTLLAEPGWDSFRATEELMCYAVRNPRGLTWKQVHAFTYDLWSEVCGPARHIDREIHEHQFMRLAYGLLQIEFSIPVEEQSRIFFEAAHSIVPLPHIEEVLAYLAARNIRTGVVSNISEAGDVLSARIGRYLPGSAFEFVIASSEYGVRKPDPLIFQLALAKAGLPPEDIWFCGDNPRCDVEGAHGLGMFPVWYEDLTVASVWRDPSHAAPACPHLHIHDWRELIEIIKDLLCTTPT